MLSLDEIIKHVEQVAYSNDDKALVCMGIKEYRELAELLRELQERRKATEIVRCGECAFCRPFLSSKTCSLGLIHTINPDIDFCSRAVRRTE